MSKTQSKFNQISLSSDDFQQGNGTDIGQIQLKDVISGGSAGDQTKSLSVQYDDKGRLTSVSENDILANTVNSFADADGDLGMGDNRITNLADPQQNTDAVNLRILNDRISAVVNGIAWKEPGEAKQASGDLPDHTHYAITANTITLDKAHFDGVSIDGVVIKAADRVLFDDLYEDKSGTPVAVEAAGGVYVCSQDGRAVAPGTVLGVGANVAGFSLGQRARITLSVINASQVVADDTQLEIYDFANNQTLIEFGELAGNVSLDMTGIAAGAGQNNELASRIAQKLNSIVTASGSRLFSAKANGNAIAIDLAEDPSSGDVPAGHSGAEVKQVAATPLGLDFGGSATASFSAVSAGGLLTFRNQADTADIEFEVINGGGSEPPPVKGQIAIDNTQNSAVAAIQIKNAIAEFADFDVTLFGNKVEVKYATAGAQGNNNAITKDILDDTLLIATAGIMEGGSDTDDTIFVRAADMDSSQEFHSAAILIQRGNTYADEGFICTVDDIDFVMNYSPVEFVRFTGTGMTKAGIGIAKSGNTLNIEMIRVDDLVLSTAEELHDFGLSASYDASYWNALQAHASTMLYLNGSLLEPASSATDVYADAGSGDGDYYIEFGNSTTEVHLAESLAVAGDKLTLIFAAQTPLV